MMETRLVFHSATIDAWGTVSIRWDKQAVNHDQVLFSGPHRVSGRADKIEGLLAATDAHLEAMGFPAVGDKDKALTVQMVAAVHDVIAKSDLARPPVEPLAVRKPLNQPTKANDKPA